MSPKEKLRLPSHMTPAIAAGIIGCSVSSVRRLVNTGKLPAEKIYIEIEKGASNGARVYQGYYYWIKLKHVLDIRDNPSRLGCPRGTKSKSKQRKARNEEGSR